MILDRIETFCAPGGVVAFVRVTDTDGATGWGQMAPYDADISCEILWRKVADHALGKPLDDLNERVIAKNLKFPWSFVCRALGGVDTAIWDLRGKRAGKPVWRLAGGYKGSSLRCYGSSMRRDIGPEEEADRLIEMREREGFDAFKVRVGAAVGQNLDGYPGRTEALIPVMRRRMGDDVDLMADGNSAYTPGPAIAVGKLMQEHGFAHFEEPCPWWEIEWTAKVAAALEMDVAGGEQDNDLAQWRRALAMGAMDVAQPDVGYVGGFTRALEVAKMAEVTGQPITPHSANRSWMTVFAAHLQLAIPNPGAYLEVSIEPTGWIEDLFEPAIRIENGRYDVGERPGWGVEVSEEWLKKADHREKSA